MPRRNDIAKLLVIGCAAVPSARATKPVAVKTVFCVMGSDGWNLHQSKPLISPKAKTEFAEMSMAGSKLLEFKLRNFSEAMETAFDYKFDADGRLNALHGSVMVPGSWTGEANLLPDADGSVPQYEVQYQLRGQGIGVPEDAKYYIRALDKVTVYRTAQSVPCGAMLQEAEKMNATQK